MSRIVAVVLLGLVLVGCRSSTSQGPVDPFLGPTRVPPPSTGSVATPPPDPSYYQPQRHAPPQSAVPVSPFPMAALPAQGTAAQPSPEVASGGWSPAPNFSGASLVSQSTTPDLQPKVESHAPAAASVHREPIVRVLEPPSRPANPPTPVSYNPVPTRVVNIVDLPRVPENASASGFRMVSATASADQADAVVSVVAEQPVEGFAPSAGHYGFDPSYAWLRGKLEYSQVDRQWKLRYIPVEGSTDQYGGSVVIMNEAALAGCERGEFVAVRGRIAGESRDHGFAPSYEVTALERVGR